MHAHPIPDYHDRISISRDVMGGKPVVKGTRVPVELVLQHFADDADFTDLLEAFPRLTLDDVQACLAYASALVGGSEAPPILRLVGTASASTP